MKPAEGRSGVGQIFSDPFGNIPVDVEKYESTLSLPYVQDFVGCYKSGRSLHYLAFKFSHKHDALLSSSITYHTLEIHPTTYS